MPLCRTEALRASVTRGAARRTETAVAFEKRRNHSVFNAFYPSGALRSAATGVRGERVCQGVCSGLGLPLALVWELK